MEKPMRNYVKRPVSPVSLISVFAAMIGLRPHFSGAFTRMPLKINDHLLTPSVPGLPPHKHGCCKRGGRSKRRRNLNYWRK